MKTIRRLFTALIIVVTVAIIALAALAPVEAQPVKQDKYGKSTAPVEAQAPSWWLP